jgi:hypothetical protein
MWKTRLLATVALMTVLSNEGIGQHLRWDDNEQIKIAVVEAQRRLGRSSCAKLLGPSAGSALTSSNYRFVALGQPTLLPNGKVRVITAVTMTPHPLILINSEGPFVRPDISIRGTRFNFSLNDIRFRALILLHEIGHVTGKFKHDADDPQQNWLYTQVVLRNCF